MSLLAKDVVDGFVSPLREEVIDGLTQRPKRLSPRLFYDARGSELFDAICELPEYYVTRTECAILRQYAAEIAGLVGKGCVLIEPGSGSSRKVRLLLPALRPAAYVPIDICAEHLFKAADELRADFRWLEVRPACADFNALPASGEFGGGGRRVVFFPGSTIGNLEPDRASRLLRRLAGLAGGGGGLLVGVDCKKSLGMLHAAYNDAQGITAAFNLNMLTRLNRELAADFDVSRFRHHAFYNQKFGRVEMHLVSAGEQQVEIGGTRIAFAPEESIHTENSYKYTVGEFKLLGRSAGLVPLRVWQDPDRLFSLHYFHVPLEATALRDGRWQGQA